MKQETTIIEFENNGQDFLRWEVEPMGGSMGKVIACKPFQASVWTQYFILNLDELKKGGHVVCSKSPTDPVVEIIHKIAKVSTKK